MDIPKYTINFSPEKSIPTNFNPVKFTTGEEQSEFNRGNFYSEIHAKHEGRSPFHRDEPKKLNPSYNLLFESGSVLP